MNLKHYKAWTEFTDEDWAEMKDLQYQCLLEVKEKFNQANTNFWLDFGTALGCYREGKILDFDSDCDVSLLGTDVTHDLLEILSPNLYRTYAKKIFWDAKDFSVALKTNAFLPAKSMRYEMKDSRGKHVKVRGHRIFTDLFCWYPLDEYYVMPFNSPHISYMRISGNIVDAGLENISFNNKQDDFPIFVNIEESLVEKYGNTWNIPDDTFHHDNKKSMKFAHVPKDILQDYQFNYSNKTYTSDFKKTQLF